MESAEMLADIHEDKKRTNEILERRSSEGVLRLVSPATPPPAQSRAKRFRLGLYGILAVPAVAVLAALAWAALR